MRYLGLVVAGSLALGACSGDKPVKEVSYKADVTPIIEANCLKCHDSADAKGTKKSGLRLDTYDGLMKGTKFGPIVIAGDADSSVLNQVVEGRVDSSIKMPHGEREMTSHEIDTLRAWVEQGAKNN